MRMWEWLTPPQPDQAQWYVQAAHRSHITDTQKNLEKFQQCLPCNQPCTCPSFFQICHIIILKLLSRCSFDVAAPQQFPEGTNKGTKAQQQQVLHQILLAHPQDLLEQPSACVLMSHIACYLVWLHSHFAHHEEVNPPRSPIWDTNANQLIWILRTLSTNRQ